MKWTILIAIAIFAIAGLVYGKKQVTPKLPKNYRYWTHTKSMVIPDKTHGLYGFHNIYANKKAFKALRKKSKKYPEGAKFVVSFYDVVEKDGTTNQGGKLMDALMIKSKTAKETGGWIFAVFDPKGKPKAINAKKDCFQCHADNASKTDFVFHKYIR